MKISDKMRLDWIQRKCAAVHYDFMDGGTQFMVEREQTRAEQAKNPWRSVRDFGWHDSIREAIDAAIREDRARRKRGG